MTTTVQRATAPAALKFFSGQLGERQVKVICSSAEVDRSGDIVVQEGIDLTAFRKAPVVLWQHDADQPIARAVEIGLENGKLAALVQFPPMGTSAKADEVYGLIKNGVVVATSIGFIATKMEPIDPHKPWGGMRFLKSELCEFSFVSVGANRDALVVGKSSVRRTRGDRRRALADLRRRHEEDTRRAAGKRLDQLRGDR